MAGDFGELFFYYFDDFGVRSLRISSAWTWYPPDLSDLTRRHFLEFTEAPGVLGIWGVWGEVRAGAYGVDTFRIMEPLGIFRFFFMWFFQVIYIDLLITKTLKH